MNNAAKPKLHLQNVVHRLLRVVLTPLIIVTMCIVALSAVISLPIWIVSGKTIIPYAVNLAHKHMELAWD